MNSLSKHVPNLWVGMSQVFTFVLACTNSIILKATCHIDKFDSGNLHVIIYKHQDTYPTDHAVNTLLAKQNIN